MKVSNGSDRGVVVSSSDDHIIPDDDPPPPPRPAMAPVYLGAALTFTGVTMAAVACGRPGLATLAWMGAGLALVGQGLVVAALSRQSQQPDCCCHFNAYFLPPKGEIGLRRTIDPPFTLVFCLIDGSEVARSAPISDPNAIVALEHSPTTRAPVVTVT